MKKVGKERRSWLENRRKKIERNRLHRARKLQVKGLSTIEQSSAGGKYLLIAPRRFSLMNNLEETLKFFHTVDDAIRKCSSQTTLFFDLAAIEDASPDAFMYIIALLKNNRRIQHLKIPCAGNVPLAEGPREILSKAGFFNYVNSKRFHPIENEESQLRIYRGIQSDPLLAQKICDFVHKRTDYSIDRIKTKRLYPMFIELMNNVKQHAFIFDKRKEESFCNWYTYAEDIGEELRFVFLDTGRGIPETVKKRFWERLPLIGTDAGFIASALKGAFRTDTGDQHRGKGLPEIYDNVKKHAIGSLRILSGKGLCLVDSDGQITENNLPYSFGGTMYVWTIHKEVDIA